MDTSDIVGLVVAAALIAIIGIALFTGSIENLPGKGDLLMRTYPVTEAEAREAHAGAVRHQADLQLIEQSRAQHEQVEKQVATYYNNLPAEAIPEPEPEPGKLVADIVKAKDGTVLYCVHWQPCQTCTFQCVKK